MLSEKQTDMRDHDLCFMFNLINLSTEITKGSNINHISKYGKKQQNPFSLGNALLNTLRVLQKELCHYQ